jgi:TrmH family RNA methyltransferase
MSSVTMIGSGPDFFSPKVIRSSMGSVFHINLHRSDSETCLAQTDLFCAAAGGQTLATCSPSTSPLLVLGSESHGLPEAFLNAGTVVGIPLHGGLESLSAPIAASILMDQIQRPLSPKP